MVKLLWGFIFFKARDMARKEYQKYITSSNWAAVRNDAVMQANNKCEVCGSLKRLNVHHLSYKNLGNEEPGDLIVLCSKCHMIEHGLIKIKKKRKRTKKKKAIYKKRKPLTWGGRVKRVCPSCREYLKERKMFWSCSCGYSKPIT